MSSKRGTDPSDPDPSNPSRPSNHTSSSSQSETPETNSSLSSRIQSSASNLARNALFTPNSPADLAQLSTGNKAGPGASSSLSSADHYNSVQSSASGSHRGPTTAEPFRSESTQGQGGFELPPLSEEEFQYQDGDYLNQELSSSQTTDKGKAAATYTHPDPFITAWHNSTTSHQQPLDGSEVLTLLTSPSFNPDFPPAPNEPFTPLETDLSSTLTPTELRILDSYRLHSSNPQQSQTQHKLTSQSLVPDIDSILNQVPGDTDATTLRDTVLTSLPGAQEWVEVEERYHDEVWGFLKPTLQAAAREIEERRDTPEKEDGPAVQRLRMALTHMKAKL